MNTLFSVIGMSDKVGLGLTFRQALAGGLLLGLSACAAPDASQDIFDPFERTNRKIHDANLAIDRTVVRPAAATYGKVVPDGPAGAINNFSFNFAEPRNAVNSLLQGRLDNAFEATLRFAINTTVGIGGLFDPATSMGIESKSTDFGETLYVWGVGEGAFIELPFAGPSTVRHTVGRTADWFMNPLTYILPTPEAYIGTASSIAWALDTRDEFAVTFDDIFDNSADSYAQTRQSYLQNRRFKLGGVPEDEVTDPFEELGL